MWKQVRRVLLLWATLFFFFVFFLLTQLIQLFWIQSGNFFLSILTVTWVVWVFLALSGYYTWMHVPKKWKILGGSIGALFFLVYGISYTQISFTPQDHTFLEYVEGQDEEYLLWQAFSLIDEEQIRGDLQNLSQQEQDEYILNILQSLWQVSYEHAIYVVNSGVLRWSFFFQKTQYLDYQKYKITEITSNLDYEYERHELGDLANISPLLVNRKNVYRVFGWLDTLVLLKNSLLDIRQEFN